MRWTEDKLAVRAQHVLVFGITSLFRPSLCFKGCFSFVLVKEVWSLNED